MDFRKKFLLTVSLRAMTGLLAFGGFCILIAPYAAKPFTGLTITAVLLAGMLYPVTFGTEFGSRRILLIVALAFSLHGTLDFPIVLWIFAPMGLAAMGSAFALPYPKKDRGGHDGKHDDVRALPSREAQERRSDDP